MKADLSIGMTALEDYEETNLHIYQKLVRKLFYLSYCTRPDIVFEIKQLSRHNMDLRKKHLGAAKQVVRYLKGTAKMGLIFGHQSIEQLPRDLPFYRLVSSADSNFTREPGD